MNFAPISLTIFLGLVGCPPSVSSEPAVIDVRTDNQVDRDLIDKAIGYFRGVCGGLQSAGVDLQQGVATLTDPYWQKRNFGWKKMVEVEVVIANEPRVLRSTHESGNIGGHHCRYAIGSGRNPAITTAKDACQLVCGWSGDFFSIPELAGLFGEEPFKRDYDFEAFKGAAFRGEYQAQRNLAYVMEYELGDIEAHDLVQACAWRKVILTSGHRSTDMADLSQEETTCGRLSAAEQSRAMTRARQLLSQIKGDGREKKSNNSLR